jgi:hypothetical protein
MNPLWIGFVLFNVVAVIAVAVVVSVRKKGPVGGFLLAAQAQALKSSVGLQLNQGKYPKLTLSLRAADCGQFEVRREGAADRFVEGLSLARAIRTADPAFGDRYHIDSDDEPFASAFFSDQSKRSAVESLFASGCTSLAWSEGQATAVWDGFRPRDENADFVGAAAAALRALTLNVPPSAAAAVSAGGWSEKDFDSKAGIALVAGFISIYATVACARFMPGRPIDGGALFMASLRVSTPLAGVFIFACLSAVRGKSWFLKAVGKLLLASVLLFPALGYVGYESANSLLDGGEARSYVLPVVGKYRSTGKHTSYYVDVSPWRPGQHDHRFEVSPSTYSRAQQGRTQARLTIRPGRFGHEWIVSLEFVDS